MVTNRVILRLVHLKDTRLLRGLYIDAHEAMLISKRDMMSMGLY